MDARVSFVALGPERTVISLRYASLEKTVVRDPQSPPVTVTIDLANLGVALAGVRLERPSALAGLGTHVFVEFRNPPIRGDSTDRGHEQWIDGNGFLLAASAPAPACQGCPVTPRFEPIAISKAIDRASPLLWQALAQGQPMGDARIEACVSSDRFCPIRLLLRDGLLVATYLGGGDEAFGLEARMIELEHQETRSSTVLRFTWDLRNAPPQ